MASEKFELTRHTVTKEITWRRIGTSYPAPRQYNCGGTLNTTNLRKSQCTLIFYGKYKCQKDNKLYARGKQNDIIIMFL